MADLRSVTSGITFVEGDGARRRARFSTDASGDALCSTDPGTLGAWPVAWPGIGAS